MAKAVLNRRTFSSVAGAPAGGRRKLNEPKSNGTTRAGHGSYRGEETDVVSSGIQVFITVSGHITTPAPRLTATSERRRYVSRFASRKFTSPFFRRSRFP